MDVGTRISINVKYIYVMTRMHFPWLNSVQPNNLDLIFYTLVRMTPQNITFMRFSVGNSIETVSLSVLN